MKVDIGGIERVQGQFGVAGCGISSLHSRPSLLANLHAEEHSHSAANLVVAILALNGRWPFASAKPDQFLCIFDFLVDSRKK